MVIWITGLSAAGKTTLCNTIYARVKPVLPELVVLDGDAVRAVMAHDLGHAEGDRLVQLHRLQHLAKLLSGQGLCVLVGVLYAHPERLEWNRRNLPEYFEVYLRASVDAVARRDPRALYEKAFRGEIKDVVGVDIPWHEPRNPDLVFDMDDPPPPAQLAECVIAAVPRLARAVRPIAGKAAAVRVR